ncbi:MAG: hypothetical protein ND895_09845 [Pyrinomonadaceae bacterium]|nr:hypothetical protein [Pyrinomonadaceae bacterium]
MPANFKASDLGEAVVAADGGCALVSSIATPLVVGRENVYVVYVTDASLASSTQSFEWSLIENGGVPVLQNTDAGEFAHVPASLGSLILRVRILGAGNAELAALSLTQETVALNLELETLIAEITEQPGPGISNPDVARELINDHNPYYQDVKLQASEAGDAFRRFVFSTMFDAALKRTASERKRHLAELAASLNGEGSDFATLAGKGAGVSGIRLPLLAMVLGMLTFTELPEANDQRVLADEELRQALAALDEEKLLDLFSMIRFPKSNISLCGRILEALRDRYFAGTSFNDLVTGLNGVRAQRIIQHFTQGPLLRT